MTTLLAESTGQFDTLAFRSAAEIIENGEDLIVVDGAGCFEPTRMTHAARIGAIDSANLMRHLHILRARTAFELEDVILNQLESNFQRVGTRNVLLSDPLSALYSPEITTRDASRILGRLKAKLEEWTRTGAQIVVLCRESGLDHGTRAHFRTRLLPQQYVNGATAAIAHAC
jgi:hypothetical protein